MFLWNATHARSALVWIWFFCYISFHRITASLSLGRVAGGPLSSFTTPHPCSSSVTQRRLLRAVTTLKAFSLTACIELRGFAILWLLRHHAVLKKTRSTHHAVTNKGVKHDAHSPQHSGRLASLHLTEVGERESGPAKSSLLLHFSFCHYAALKIWFAFSIFFTFLT